MATTVTIRVDRLDMLAKSLPWIVHQAAMVDGTVLSIESGAGRGNSCYRLSMACRCGCRYLILTKDLARGYGCPECRERDRHKAAQRFLLQAKELAARRGGRCLSASYENARTPLEWSCAFGHHWRASLDNVKGKRSWCPTCQRRAPRPGRRKHRVSVPVRI